MKTKRTVWMLRHFRMGVIAVWVCKRWPAERKQISAVRKYAWQVPGAKRSPLTAKLTLDRDCHLERQMAQPSRS